MKRLWLAAILFSACATDVDPSAMTFDHGDSNNLEFVPSSQGMTCSDCDPDLELDQADARPPECDRNADCADDELCHRQRCVPVLQPTGR